MEGPKLLALAGLTIVTVFMLFSVKPKIFEGFGGMPTAFVESDVTKADNGILEVYQEILHRQPSPSELSTQRNAISTGQKSLAGLRRELRDSEEYIHSLKLQSNAMAPELPKLINDRDVLDLITYMYKLERKKDIPREMLLPLRDVYAYYNYDNARFRAFLRLKKYPLLEEAIRRDPTFDRDDLIAWLEENVDQNELDALTKQIRKEMEDAAGKGSGSSSSSAFLPGLGTGWAPASHTGCGTMSAEEAARLMDLLQRSCTAKGQSGDGTQGSCGAGGKSGKSGEPATQKMYLPHEGDMVLRPEYEWSVPQRQPPICTRVGSETPVAPTMTNSKIGWFGTPLDEAADTAVGSILPKFEYKPYIDVPASCPMGNCDHMTVDKKGKGGKDASGASCSK